MIYLQLFLSFLQIGLFSIGGGYAALPLIQYQVVDHHRWLSLSEFTDLITIAEMTPGPIAINSATFVGTRIAGLPGALISTFGNVLPSFVIVSILAYLYYKYKNVTVLQEVLSSLRPAVIALIASAGLSILTMVVWNGSTVGSFINRINGAGLIIFLIALTLLRKVKLSPIKVMMLSGVIAFVMDSIGVL